MQMLPKQRDMRDVIVAVPRSDRDKLGLRAFAIFPHEVLASTNAIFGIYFFEEFV